MSPLENAAWIRGFATALADSFSGGGRSIETQMRAAGLTLADLRVAGVLDSSINVIAANLPPEAPAAEALEPLEAVLTKAAAGAVARRHGASPARAREPRRR